MLSKALNFIYAGQNERPIRPLNFRDRTIGGLGLVNPIVKSKALLLKSMHREFVLKGCNLNDRNSYKDIYGYTGDFTEVMKVGVMMSMASNIYKYLIEEVICRNNSVIPSRSEKRSEHVQWRIAWQNWRELRGVDAEEFGFAWNLQQDMLKIGARLHRPNAEKRCLAVLEGGVCQEIEFREHLFISCERVKDLNSNCLRILGDFLAKEVPAREFINLAFNHRNKKRLRSAIWFAVKVMYLIYTKRMFSKIQVLQEIVKEIDWNLDLNRKIGSKKDLNELKNLIKSNT